MVLHASTVLICFLNFLETKRVPYCIVGDTDGFSDAIDGDVDIIVPQKKVKSLHGIMLSFCEAQDFRLVQCLQHENNAFYYVVQWWENNLPRFLKLDICGDYYRKAKLFLQADELLTHREEATESNGNGKGFFVPEPAAEFIYYLLKKIDKGGLNLEQSRHLHRQWEKDPEGCLSNVKKFWDQNDSRLIQNAAETNEWQQIVVNIQQLQKSIHRNVRVTLQGLLGEFLRRVRRVLLPTGFVVSFLGPDGTGKSSVLNAVAESLSPAFRKKANYHLRPYLLPARSAVDSGTVTNPHVYKEYSLIISSIKLFYIWFDYFIGHFTVIRWKKIFSTFILFDRYFQDIMADRKRFRYGGPLWLVNALSQILPSPDVLIFLHAPADIIQERKKEVPYNECVRQVESYKQVAGILKNAVIIDASQPLGNVVADVNKHVLNILGERTEERLRLL